MKLTYDAISPISGNKTVFIEDSMYLCMETGYHTYDTFLSGTENQEWFNEQSTQYIRDTRFFDPKTMLYWYKITMFSDKSILYPDENGWNVAELESTNDSETKKIIESSVKTFEQFEPALDEFYKLKNQ